MPKKGEIDLQKFKYWKSVLAKYEDSGLSGQAFCRANGIPYTAFANRRRRMAKLQFQPTLPQFAEIEIKDNQSPVVPADRLEVVLPNGVLVRVPCGYSSADLANLFLALDGGRC